MFGKSAMLIAVLGLLCGPAFAGDWVNGFKPGARYSFFHPGQSNLGACHGTAFELVIVDWFSPGDTGGSGYGRLYFTMDLLKGADSDDWLKAYAGGISYSMERNPLRDFLVPFYAIELGGLTHPRSGKEFVVQPWMGFYVLAQRRITVDMAGGYLLPAGHFRELHGWRARAGLTISFW